MPEDILIRTWSYFNSGGGVMWPLLALSIWMWWLILLKVWDFTVWRRRERPIHDLVSGPDTGLGAPWQQYIIGSAASLQPGDQSREEAERVEWLTRPAGRKIEAHIETILVLAKAAPLLGLLGTVCGMISTFEVISGFGTGQAKAMAGGISEALITTQTGLLVAVPGLVLGSLLRKRAEVVKARMHRFTLALVRHLDTPGREMV